MSQPFAFGVSTSDYELLLKTKEAGLRAHADLEPLGGGVYLEPKASGLAIMSTFSEDIDVAVPGLVGWEPEDRSSQHTEAINALLGAAGYLGRRVEPKYSWEVVLSEDDHPLLERAARHGLAIGLDLARGICICSLDGPERMQLSFISELNILNTVSESLLDPVFHSVETAFEALIAKEREWLGG